VNAIRAWWRRIPPIVVDLLAVAVAAADAYLGQHGRPLTLGVCILGCAALLLRRRWPALAFVLTLPAALIANVLAAPSSLCSACRRAREPGACWFAGAAFAAAEAIGWPIVDQLVVDQSWTAVTFVYQAATAAAPILLGQLLQTTEDLHARLEEIEATKRHERELYAQTVLARSATSSPARCTMSSRIRSA
jgi:hypothetical protein